MKKILIISSCILAVLVITLGFNTHLNYMKYVKTLNELNNYKEKTSAYKEQLETLKNKKTDVEIKKENEKINKNVTGFLNAYYNYSNKNRGDIYTKIKPYTTDYLQNKVKPNGNSSDQSTVNYSVNIKNIRIYRISDYDDSDTTNVLIVADEGMQTDNSNSNSTTLIELKIRNINSNWLVDDIIQNKTFQDKINN